MTQTMQDSELLAIIEQEARQAVGADDVTAQDRAKMLSAYMGEAKHDLAPPEVEGRSRVVSKDLMDTVEWIMPSLMRMFASSDDVIRFEPESQEDEQAVQDATDYVAYLFWRKNPGFRTLHDAIKNALIQRQSVVKVYCDETWDERTERYTGLSALDVQALSGDPEIEVVEQAPDGEALNGQAMEPTFTVTAKRKSKRRNIRVIGVPPEEIRFNRAARSVEDARFIQQRTMTTVSDLRSLGYDQAKIDRLPSDPGDRNWQAEQSERGEYDNTLSDAAQARLDDALREIELCETYTKVDHDGDGIAEYRRVVHAGGVIFENEETDDHPFALFCPILMPFKAVGLGLWDLCEDLQRIRTVLTRQLLDNAYLANNPVTDVVEGQVNLDDVLNRRAGGVRRVKSLEAIRESVVPFIGGQALTLLDHFGQARDKRTGVTEFNQGLGADALSKTEIGSEGAQSMMEAAMQRVELIARVFAETGVARVWRLLLKRATQYTDREQQVKVAGRWLRVNPREWNDGYDTSVTIGIGHQNQQQKMRNLALIGQAQEKLLPLGLVTPENAHATAVDIAQAAGYRDADRYFTNPKDAPPRQEGPPPEVVLEQMKQQGAMQLEQLRAQSAQALAQSKAQTDQMLAQSKAQADIEVARMEQEFQALQAQQETQLEAERDRMKMEADMALEQFKVEKQAEIETLKAQIARETAVTVAQISAQNRPEPTQ